MGRRPSYFKRGPDCTAPLSEVSFTAMSPRHAILLAATLTGSLFIGGCSIPPVKVDPVQMANVISYPDEMQTTVLGDWDDLDAAITIGLGKLNLAVLDVTVTDPLEVALDLVDVLDRPARLTIARATDAPSGPIVIRASFRDRQPDRERLLVAAVAQRFAELHGAEIAPVR